MSIKQKSNILLETQLIVQITQWVASCYCVPYWLLEINQSLRCKIWTIRRSFSSPLIRNHLLASRQTYLGAQGKNDGVIFLVRLCTIPQFQKFTLSFVPLLHLFIRLQQVTFCFEILFHYTLLCFSSSLTVWRLQSDKFSMQIMNGWME